MPHERYKGIILPALPVEDEGIRMACYEKQDFVLEDI